MVASRRLTCRCCACWQPPSAACQDVEAWIRARGWVNPETGEAGNVVDVEQRLRREAAQYLDALGCSPAARVRLGLDIARGQQTLVLSDLVRDTHEHMLRKEQDAAIEAQAREIRAQRILDEGKRDRDA
jgi:hypothetical protein